MPHEKKLNVVRTNNLCFNCFPTGHSVMNCRNNNRCRKCQRPHHPLLHSKAKSEPQNNQPPLDGETSAFAVAPLVTSNTHPGSSENALLMTFQVLVHSPDGSHLRARCLIDSCSTTSFISMRLAKSLRLIRST